jgi:hypothetical protein
VFDRAGSFASDAAVVDGARAALFVGATIGALAALAALGIPTRARVAAAPSSLPPVVARSHA